MARIKLSMPHEYLFTTAVHVRISDINYGNHLANHAYLEYMQEARMQFFMHHGFSEKDIGGCGVIMGDTCIVFKKECFYGDLIDISVTAAEFGVRSFDLFYRFSRRSDQAIVCEAKTGMVCYDYIQTKTVEVPLQFRQHFGAINT